MKIDISIPHLDYVVKVRDIKTRPPELKNCDCYTRKENDRTCTIYLSKNARPPVIAHETIHVLQFMCNSLDLDFIQEMEHMGYIMQYIMARILHYDYVKPHHPLT